jgi:O-antigen/teichoic acid export membrane protein
VNRDIVFYGALIAISKGLQFLMLPLLTRLFSPADYGLIDLMATFTSVATMLMSLSLESAIARMWHDTPEHANRTRLLTSVIAFVAASASVIFLAIWVVLIVLEFIPIGLANIAPIALVASATAVLMSIASIPQIVLRMERRIVMFGILQIANTGLGIVFALVMILHFRMGLLGLFFGYLTASALALGVSLYATRQYMQFTISRSDIEEGLKYSLPMLPAVLLRWSNNQVDRLILLPLLGLGAVGVYGAAAMIAMSIGVLGQVFQLAWLPVALAQLDQPSRNSYFRKSLTAYLAVMTCISLFIVAYSREILILLTRDDYASGYVVIPWLVGAHIFYGSASITNIGMLITKKTGGNSIAAALGTAVNIALGLVLVPVFGIIGAAVGTFIAAALFTSLLLRFSLRQVAVSFDIRHSVGISTVFVATCIGVLLLYEYSDRYSAIGRTALLGFSLAIVSFWSIRSMRHPKPPDSAIAAV